MSSKLGFTEIKHSFLDTVYLQEESTKAICQSVPFDEVGGVCLSELLYNQADKSRAVWYKHSRQQG